MRLRWRLWVCLPILFFALSGCGAKGGPPRLPEWLEQPFHAKAVLQYDDFVAEGLLSREEDGSFLLEFDAPEVLKGMIMRFETGQVTIEYRGLTGNYRTDSIPQAAMGNLLAQASQRLCSGEEIDLEWEESALLAKGRLQRDGAPFVWALDAPTGTLQSLSVPSHSFRADFSDGALSSR